MTASEVRCVRCGSVYLLPVYSRALGDCYAAKQAVSWLAEHECRPQSSRRMGSRANAAFCGTRGGYNAHRRRGENACDDCKAAAAEYMRRRYRPCSSVPVENAETK